MNSGNGLGRRPLAHQIITGQSPNAGDTSYADWATPARVGSLPTRQGRTLPLLISLVSSTSHNPWIVACNGLFKDRRMAYTQWLTRWLAYAGFPAVRWWVCSVREDVGAIAGELTCHHYAFPTAKSVQGRFLTYQNKTSSTRVFRLDINVPQLKIIIMRWK